MVRLRILYKDKLVPQLQEELGLSNIMQVPRVKKITLNMGVGEAVKDKKVMDFALRDLEAISGQKPVVTKSKKINCRI
jgi:large subunit ribosomal protein L5